MNIKRNRSRDTAETTPAEPARTPMTAGEAPMKLKLLVTVVNRAKAEFYADYLQSGFQVNMQTILAAEGTADSETLRLLGLADSSKCVIYSVIREDQAHAALQGLEEKFRTIKNGKGIACTIPLTGTVGVAIYRFLGNLTA